MFKDLYNYTGPFADLAGGTLEQRLVMNLL